MVTSSDRIYNAMNPQTLPGKHVSGQQSHVVALILAAGESRRMGSPKPLLSLGNKTVLEQSVGLFLNAGVETIRVVTGCHHDIIRDRLPDLPVQWVHNYQFEKGMFYSIVKGLQEIRPEDTWFFLFPVDIPLVRPRTISTLLEARSYLKSGVSILHPTFMDKRGHPPLIHASHIPDILAWNGLKGLEGFFEGLDANTLEIPVFDEFIGKDMDTPSDYEALSAALNRRHIPSVVECTSILKDASMFPEKTAAHCRQVARLAVYLSNRLTDSNVEIDIGRIRAAALLHDIAKGQPNHAEAGAALLLRYGFSGITDIVATHVDIDVPEEGPPTEAEVVYLADKLVKGDNLTSLSDRFDRKLVQYGHNPSARAKIVKRKADADAIVKRIEHFAGMRFQEILDGFTQGGA